MNQSPKTLPLKRILLKISGESFGTQEPFSFTNIEHIVDEIAQIHKEGVQTAVVMGGGNIVRGANLEKKGIVRTTGDDMGMLATVINALVLQDLLKTRHTKSCIITAHLIAGIGEIYQRDKCLDYLENMVVLFAGGTGHPYFTTDTAAALRGVEIQAECLLKGTKVDGVFEDYVSDTTCGRKLDSLTFQQALAQQYKVMDLTAVAFCMENKLPIRVFNLMKPGNLLRALQGEVGTVIM